MNEEKENYIPTVTDNSPASMMQIALSRGADLDKLEKMLALQERWEANEAKKAYHTAMAAFKAAPPEIEKDKKVSFGAGKAAYSHATLANVTDKINQALSAHGLSAAWKTAQDERGITVTCTITHRLGHSESTSLTAAPDNSGSKNAIQAVGSTITYLSRYTLLSLTGLATHDQDDDGNGASATLSPEQVAEIERLIKETGSDKAAFLKYLGAESVDKILASAYAKAVAALNAKKKATKREPGQEG